MRGSPISSSGTNTLVSTAAYDIPDNILFTLGNDSDIAQVLSTSAITADATLTGVIEGTARHLATAVNSLLISNVTNDGDIQFLVSDGGHSWGMLTFNADDHSAHFGQSDWGVDVKFWGATANYYLLWDESGDDLILAGANATFSIDATLDSSSTTTGSFHTDGGVGIAKALYVGARIDLSSATLNVADNDVSFINIGSYDAALASTTQPTVNTFGTSLHISHATDATGDVWLTGSYEKLSIVTNNQPHNSFVTSMVRMDIQEEVDSAYGIQSHVKFSTDGAVATDGEVIGISAMLYGAIATTRGLQWAFKADQRATGAGTGRGNSAAIFGVTTEDTGAIVRLENLTNTVQDGITIQNSGTMTNGIYFVGTMTTGIDLGDNCTTGISIGTCTTGISSAAPIIVGASDTGYDVKFWGATADHYMLWDESADELVIKGRTYFLEDTSRTGEGTYLFGDGGGSGLNIGMATPGDCQGIKMEFKYGVSPTLTGGGKNVHGMDIKMTMDQDWDFNSANRNATIRGGRIQGWSQDDVGGKVMGIYCNARAEGTSKTVKGIIGGTDDGPGIVSLEARTELGSSATITSPAIVGLEVWHNSKTGATFDGAYRAINIHQPLMPSITGNMYGIWFGDDHNTGYPYDYALGFSSELDLDQVAHHNAGFSTTGSGAVDGWIKVEVDGNPLYIYLWNTAPS